MTATASATQTKEAAASAWQGFRTGLWQKEINVRDFIQQNYTLYDGDDSFLAPATARTQKIWNTLQDLFVEERRKSVLDVSQNPELDYRPRARLHRSRERNHRRAADRCSAQARDHAERRFPPRAQCAQDLRLRARSACRRGVHQVSEDPQRCGVRRLHGGYPEVPQLARSHGPAGRLRPWPHHRRLPAGRPLRSEPAHRAQAGGEARARRLPLDR